MSSTPGGEAAFRAWLEAFALGEPRDEQIRSPLVLIVLFGEFVPQAGLRRALLEHRARHERRVEQLRVTVTSSTAATLPISVSSGVTSIDVAIWWPEGQSAHNDIDMQLLKPDGTVAVSSTGSGSVWEKAHFATTTAGTWTIRAYPYSVSGSQTVYVAGIRR